MISTRPIEKEVGSNQIFQKASAWLNECLHGQLRGRKIHKICPRPKENYLPKRLIEISSHTDGLKLKLQEMEGCPAESYAALSYCWGTEQTMKSTKAMISRWMTGIPWDELPQTLKDVMIVCQKLDIRLLWIDAFCIVQDDANEKAVEIAQMPHIYRNSTVTISPSRASSVLEGFLGERTGTEHPDLVFELPYQCIRPANRGSVTLIRTRTGPEPLDTRGWALQERLLSPRTIEFGSRQLRFICQHNPRGFADGWTLKPEASDPRQDMIDDIAILQADFDALQGDQHHAQGTAFEEPMEHWCRLVTVYTHRRLTEPADRILAISGIAERYGRVFGDQYCAGLWRSTLARSLYWNTLDNQKYPRPHVWQGPSWSWTSIDGPVDFPPIVPHEEETQILAVDIELANPANPYGAILSGRLTLKARLLPAVLSFEEHPFHGMVVNAASLAMNGSLGDIFRIRISYDIVEPTSEERAENNAVFLELSSKCDERSWSCRGLIARSLSADTFTRVGTFDFETSEYERRQDEESLDAWQQRVDHNFSWFSRCEVRVFDLV